MLAGKCRRRIPAIPGQWHASTQGNGSHFFEIRTVTEVPRSCPATQLSPKRRSSLILDLTIWNCTGQLRPCLLCESFRACFDLLLGAGTQSDNVPSHEDVLVTMAMLGPSLSVLLGIRCCITRNFARDHPILRASFCDMVRCRTPRTLCPSFLHGHYLFFSNLPASGVVQQTTPITQANILYRGIPLKEGFT